MESAPILDEEVIFEGGVSISSTDLNGIITYANRKFAEMSGYTRQELKGSNHNIVRHPDMPKAAFKELWETIQQGNEWVGVIKNLRKDGRYYWAYTHITPVIEEGKVVGYSAVRRPASPMEIEESLEKYTQMKAHENKPE